MTGVERVAWVLLLVPALRVALRRPVIRECREHPRRAVIGMLLAAAGIALIAWSIQERSWARLALLAMLWLLVAWSWLHAQPWWGRHLPPGSLGLLTSLDALEQPDWYAMAVQRWGPVFKMSQFHRPVLCIADLGIARTFLVSQSAGLRQSGWGLNRLVPGGYVEFLDGAAHAAMRGALVPGFNQSVLEAVRPELAAMVDDALAALEQASERAGLVDPAPIMDQLAATAVLRYVLGESQAPQGDAGSRSRLRRSVGGPPHRAPSRRRQPTRPSSRATNPSPSCWKRFACTEARTSIGRPSPRAGWASGAFRRDGS